MIVMYCVTKECGNVISCCTALEASLLPKGHLKEQFITSSQNNATNPGLGKHSPYENNK